MQVSRRVVVPLIVLILILGTMHYALSGTDLSVARLFDLDQEASLGTWLSSVLAFAAACLAMVIAIQLRPRQASGWIWWALLGLAMIALSVDEVAQIHEPLGDRVGALRSEQGARMAGTPLLGIALLPGVIVGCVALWKVGARKARTLLVVGLVVFWIGAFGFEELEYRNFERTLFLTRGMTMETGDFLLVGIQEILELTGTSLVVTGLVSQLATIDDFVRAKVGRS